VQKIIRNVEFVRKQTVNPISHSNAQLLNVRSLFTIDTQASAWKIDRAGYENRQKIQLLRGTVREVQNSIRTYVTGLLDDCSKYMQITPKKSTDRSYFIVVGGV